MKIEDVKTVEDLYKYCKEIKEKNGVKMMGTFHPAALLRNPNNKPAAFEDFVKIRDIISEEDFD